MENREFHSIGQVAQLLGVSDRTVRRLIWKGDLEAIKVGKSVRIANKHIEVYTSRNKFKSNERQPQKKLLESKSEPIPKESIDEIIREFNTVKDKPQKKRYSLRGMTSGSTFTDSDINEARRAWEK